MLAEIKDVRRAVDLVEHVLDQGQAWCECHAAPARAALQGRGDDALGEEVPSPEQLSQCVVAIAELSCEEGAERTIAGIDRDLPHDVQVVGQQQHPSRPPVGSPVESEQVGHPLVTEARPSHGVNSAPAGVCLLLQPGEDDAAVEQRRPRRLSAAGPVCTAVAGPVGEQRLSEVGRGLDQPGQVPVPGQEPAVAFGERAKAVKRSCRGPAAGRGAAQARQSRAGHVGVDADDLDPVGQRAPRIPRCDPGQELQHLLDVPGPVAQPAKRSHDLSLGRVETPGLVQIHGRRGARLERDHARAVLLDHLADYGSAGPEELAAAVSGLPDGKHVTGCGRGGKRQVAVRRRTAGGTPRLVDRFRVPITLRHAGQSR